MLLWAGRLSLIDKVDLRPLVQAFAALEAGNPGRALRATGAPLGLGEILAVLTRRASPRRGASSPGTCSS
ncbi:hypothetical protein [Sorangium sp. So ce233]|uniref:hypothetical protein n=1 Tax=Sorangium sp. So ce233 TaxID=3133290 RepID=UPI003F627A02